jgi:hypothetical protein
MTYTRCTSVTQVCRVSAARRRRSP